MAGFPAATMPSLPLAWAAGSGADVTVPHGRRQTLTPGTYGMLVLGRHSKVLLARGRYIFAGVRLADHAKLLVASDSVSLGIIGKLTMASGAVLAAAEDGKAADLVVSVLGSIAKGDTVAPSPYTVSIGRHAVVRGLLAAAAWHRDDQ